MSKTLLFLSLIPSLSFSEDLQIGLLDEPIPLVQMNYESEPTQSPPYEYNKDSNTLSLENFNQQIKTGRIEVRTIDFFCFKGKSTLTYSIQDTVSNKFYLGIINNKSNVINLHKDEDNKRLPLIKIVPAMSKLTYQEFSVCKHITEPQFDNIKENIDNMVNMNKQWLVNLKLDQTEILNVTVPNIKNQDAFVAIYTYLKRELGTPYSFGLNFKAKLQLGTASWESADKKKVINLRWDGKKIY